jgi:hypothetical protein
MKCIHAGSHSKLCETGCLRCWSSHGATLGSRPPGTGKDGPVIGKWSQEVAGSYKGRAGRSSSP